MPLGTARGLGREVRRLGDQVISVTRGRAARIARQVHILKVDGSNPSPATSQYFTVNKTKVEFLRSDLR